MTVATERREQMTEVEPSERVLAGSLTEIVERLMTHHWDMKACECWVCKSGRALECRPRSDYLIRNEHFPPVDKYGSR